jgi:hypothetical protein
VPENSAKEGTPTRVDAHDFPAAIDLGDLDLVGDDDAATHQVDEVTSEEVFGEEELSRSTLKTAKVDSQSLEGHAALGETTDLLYRDEEISSLNANDGAHDRRVRVVTETRDQVLDASDSVTVGVEDLTAQESGEVKNLRHQKP